ncbi:MAG: DUF6069 family protein [Candidatus Promineifilaceae bacterium]|nr:DUF6069 family protein [Candidatus Promineifilaceae bacterium]
MSAQIDRSRIWWVGLLAVLIATVANVVLAIVARAVLDISPDFNPLAGNSTVILLTVIGVGLGVIIFYLVSGRSAQPVQTFRSIVLIALLLSFLPDIGMLIADLPGATVVSVTTLMIMHVVAAVICYQMLVRLTRA